MCLRKQDKNSTFSAVRAFPAFLSVVLPMPTVISHRGDFARVHTDSWHSVESMARSLEAWIQPLTPETTVLYVASDTSPAELQNLEELLKGGLDSFFLLSLTLGTTVLYVALETSPSELQNLGELFKGGLCGFLFFFPIDPGDNNTVCGSGHVPCQAAEPGGALQRWAVLCL